MNIAPVPNAANLMVTQGNCQAVLGLTRRQYLRLVRVYGIRHRRVGKLVCTAAEAWRGWLTEGLCDTAQQDGAEAVLARAGLRVTG
jgi:hypothetical protein